ncbi:MAG TPA: hypothetical protein VM597_31765 [Gemmataceae bacterium]|jgi:hypothetical protein|nr:hypothetical protein [Gemmataceae bacterium]
MATSHGSEPFVPQGPTHNKGYEPDEFGVKTILAVPAAVIITSVIAFVITWVIFGNLFDPRFDNPPAEVEAAKLRNAEPLNDRLARISSTDPKAEVNAPRLEGMRRTEVHFRDGKPDNASRYNVVTAELTSTQPLKDGSNPPYYHPEDLRPERSPVLTKGGAAEGGEVRIPIDQAIAKLASGGSGMSDTKDVKQPINAHWDLPKESNGGVGAKPPAPKADGKKEPEKGPAPKEEKKDEKKEPEKK